MPKFVKRNETTKIKAVKEFTDRKEPRKVFWDKYQELDGSEEMPISVITYYGYGGIGKSALLKKLEEELREKAPDTKYITLNFEKVTESNDLLASLKIIRQELKEKYSFDFPFFDLVVYDYETKLGKNPTKEEFESVLKGSKEFEFLLDIISDIPLIGNIKKIVERIEKGREIIKDRLDDQKLRENLISVDDLTPAEINDKLAYYFAQDLSDNLKNNKHPFVIFIDTYEKLVNELSTSGNPLDNDLWLRGDDGLIIQLPNALWVIGGREKLKWEQEDEDWAGSLDQHLLGTLSLQDSKTFLNRAGIEDENLVNEIFKISQGNPMYLDLCVDTYVHIIESGKTPEAKDFGNDTTKLVKRFMMYMSDTERDFCNILALASEWTDSSIIDFSKHILGSFSPALYDKIKDFSFIVSDGKTYKIQSNVRDILLNNISQSLKDESTNYKHLTLQKKLHKIVEDREAKVSKISDPKKRLVAYTDNYEIEIELRNHIIQLQNLMVRASTTEEFQLFARDYLEAADIALEETSNSHCVFPRFLKAIEKFNNTPEYYLLKVMLSDSNNDYLVNKTILADIDAYTNLAGNGDESRVEIIERYISINILAYSKLDWKTQMIISRALINATDLANPHFLVSLGWSNFITDPNMIQVFMNGIKDMSIDAPGVAEARAIESALSLRLLEKHSRATVTIGDGKENVFKDKICESVILNKITQDTLAMVLKKYIEIITKNPKLLTYKTMIQLSALDTAYLRNETGHILFDFLYQIRNLMFKTNDQYIITHYIELLYMFLPESRKLYTKNYNSDISESQYSMTARILEAEDKELAKSQESKAVKRFRAEYGNLEVTDEMHKKAMEIFEIIKNRYDELYGKNNSRTLQIECATHPEYFVDGPNEHARELLDKAIARGDNDVYSTANILANYIKFADFDKRVNVASTALYIVKLSGVVIEQIKKHEYVSKNTIGFLARVVGDKITNRTDSDKLAEEFNDVFYPVSQALDVQINFIVRNNNKKD